MRSNWVREGKHLFAKQELLAVATPWLLAGLLFLAALPGMWGFLKPGFSLWVSLGLLPFVLQVESPGRWSLRYGWLAILCFAGFGWLHIQSLLVFGLGTSLLLVVEAYRGKTAWPVLMLFALMSPLPMYLARVLTFSLRLKMSALAGQCLQWLQLPVEVQGNLFRIQGESFSVDPACMGLHSLITGLFLLTLLIAMTSKRQGIHLRTVSVGGLYLFGGLLLLVANQIRIIALVLFHSPAGSLSHDLIGLSCLLVYACLPLWVLLRWLSRQSWAIQPLAPLPVASRTARIASLRLPLILCLAAGIGLLSFTVKPSVSTELANPEMANLPKGIQWQLLSNGVFETRSPERLIYLKPPVPPWRSDHSPAICWQASGHEMKQIELIQIGEQTLWKAVFIKGEERFHTAWWYDNGSHQTHRQLDWRWRSLQGEAPFWLVNVSAIEEKELLRQCETLLCNKWHVP